MRRLITVAAGTLALALAAAAPTGEAPAVGADAASTDLREVAGVTAYGDGHAVPLAAAEPEWLTDDLEQQVVAADGPVAAPQGAGADLPASGSVGIRPGSWMVSPAGCTMNFVFAKGGDLAIGTAGHCISGEEGPGGGKGKGKNSDPVILLTVAPGGSNPVLIELGSVLVSRDNGIGDDFALVAIPQQYHDWVYPTIAQVLGPCGGYSGDGPETVAHYGHGLVIGTGGTSRAGVALTWFDDAYGWDGAAIFGDSGSPVRVTDLSAAGNLTHLVVDSRYLPSVIAGTRIGRILELTKGYTLVDSPYCP